MTGVAEVGGVNWRLAKLIPLYVCCLTVYLAESGSDLILLATFLVLL